MTSRRRAEHHGYLACPPRHGRQEKKLAPDSGRTRDIPVSQYKYQVLLFQVHQKYSVPGQQQQQQRSVLVLRTAAAAAAVAALKSKSWDTQVPDRACTYEAVPVCSLYSTCYVG